MDLDIIRLIHAALFAGQIDYDDVRLICMLLDLGYTDEKIGENND